MYSVQTIWLFPPTTIVVGSVCIHGIVKPICLVVAFEINIGGNVDPLLFSAFPLDALHILDIQRN